MGNRNNNEEQEYGFEDDDKLESILLPGGMFSQKLKSYEYREEQIQLMRAVRQVFREDQVLIAEAGTGVGKSMAYLLPAILWAIENNERVVISTATIALGQQIIRKDIPMVIKALGREMKAMLINGRGNYLCRKRLGETRASPGLFHSGQEPQVLGKMVEWAEKTKTGNRVDLDFTVSDFLWREVRAEHDNCAWTMCPLYKVCFLRYARSQAMEAPILVTNHHLLFADLAARMEGVDMDDPAVLPPYSRVIIDEAQHMESSASSLFASALSIPALKRSINFVYHPGNRKSLVDRILPYLGYEEVPGPNPASEMEINIEHVQRATAIWTRNIRMFMGDGAEFLLSGTPGEQERNILFPALLELKNAIASVITFLASLLHRMVEEVDNEEQKSLKIELGQRMKNLQEMAELADSFLNRKDFPDNVFWLKKKFSSDGSSHVECHRTPLSVAQTMCDILWETLPTVVSLSATLSFNGDFTHWKRQVGVEDASRHCVEKLLPSPFDYLNNAFLGVPRDAPEPGHAEVWESFLVKAISRCIEISGGRALVLFTSYATLGRSLNGVRNVLGDEAPPLLEQEKGDKGRLLTDFRDKSSSVLFATNTFLGGGLI